MDVLTVTRSNSRLGLGYARHSQDARVSNIMETDSFRVHTAVFVLFPRINISTFLNQDAFIVQVKLFDIMFKKKKKTILKCKFRTLSAMALSASQKVTVTETVIHRLAAGGGLTRVNPIDPPPPPMLK